MFPIILALVAALALTPVLAYADIKSGIELGEYLNNTAQRQEESRRRSDLLRAQAQQLEAQTKLLQQQLQQMQQPQSRCLPTTTTDCYVCCSVEGECKPLCTK